MTLKNELELLREGPFPREVLDAEVEVCYEVSDVTRLCKKPLVTVQMVTYNHEAYIRQAIEGVLSQEVSFEYELIIGEDCSQDRTREICLEYQRQYPEKVRLLWGDKNVGMSANNRRVAVKSRGEFIALCEGDDYWIDPKKLQKQVNIMRKYPNVGLCFTGAKIVQHQTNKWTRWDPKQICKPGLMSGAHYFRTACAGYEDGVYGPEAFLMTATLLYRAALLQKCYERYDIFNWQVLAWDIRLRAAMSTISDFYYLETQTAVYRRNPGSILALNGHRVNLDATLTRFYFLIVNQKIGEKFRCPPALLIHLFERFLLVLQMMPAELQEKKLAGIPRTVLWRAVFLNTHFLPLFLLMRKGKFNREMMIRVKRHLFPKRRMWSQ